MSGSKEFDFEAFEDKPVTAQEVAEMLPNDYKYYLSGLKDADNLTRISTIALMGAQIQLAEFGIVNIRTRAEQRQEAWDNADWITVETIDYACEGLGKPEDFIDITITQFGIDVIAVCNEMNPDPPQQV